MKNVNILREYKGDNEQLNNKIKDLSIATNDFNNIPADIEVYIDELIDMIENSHVVSKNESVKQDLSKIAKEGDSNESKLIELINVTQKEYLSNPKALEKHNLQNAYSLYFLEIVVNDWSKFKTLIELSNKISQKGGKYKIGDEYETTDTFKNIQKSLWAYIPEENKKISKISRVKYKPTPDDKGLIKLTKDFVANDELRPVMNSVHFEKGEGEVATDAHKLIWIFNHAKLEGNYCLHKTCRNAEKSENVKVKDISYPQFKGVIPYVVDYEHTDIEADSLRRYLKGVSEIIKFDSLNKVYLSNNDIIHAFDYVFLKESIDTMQKLGHNDLTIAFGTEGKAIVISPKGKMNRVNDYATDFILLMPKLNTVSKNQLVFNANNQTVYSYETEFKEFPLKTSEIKTIAQEEQFDKKVEKVEKTLEEVERIKQELEQQKLKAQQEAEAKAEQDRLNKIIEDRKNKIDEMNKRIDTIEGINIEEEELTSNYYLINEMSKYELYFDYGTYQELESSLKKDVKSYFLWSRKKKAWISKAKAKSYHIDRLIEKLGLSFKGKAKRMSFEDEINRKKTNAEYRDERYDAKAIKADERAVNLQSEFNKLRKDWSWLTQPIISGHSGSQAFAKQKQRVINNYDKGFEEMNKAEYYRQKKQLAEDTLNDSKLKSPSYLDNRIKDAEKSIRKISKWVAEYQDYISNNELTEEKKNKYLEYIEDGLDKLKYNYDKLAYYQLAKENLKAENKAKGIVTFDRDSTKKLAKALKPFIKEHFNITPNVSSSQSFITIQHRPLPNELRKAVAEQIYPKDDFSNSDNVQIGNIAETYISLYPKKWLEFMKSKGYDDAGIFKKGGQIQQVPKIKKFGGVDYSLHSTGVTKAGIIKIKKRLLKENPNTYFRTFRKNLYILQEN